MAEIEEVGVEAVVRGFPAFMLKLGAMSKAIQATGTAGIAAKVGLVVFTVALAAVVAVAAAVVAGVALIAGAFLAVGIASVAVARSVESAFAGVAKTTNGLTDEFGKMNEAGEAVLNQFRDLAKEVPLSLEDLLKIGELAGQLGIAKEALAGFSEVVAGLAVATDLTIEEAALGLARLASIYGVTTEDMIDNTERLGSAITFLGNNFATNEPFIVNFSKRLAGIAKQFGITQQEVLGFGAAIGEAGVEAQLGSTAIQNALIGIGKAVSTGGDELEEFARVAGMSAEEFSEAWKDDAAQAFISFIEGLGEAGDEAFAILDEVGLSSDRTVRALIPLAAAGDLLSRAIDGANIAFEENNQLTREVTIRYATFDSQMQVFKNTIRDVGLEIGFSLLPILSDFLKIVSPIVKAIGEGLVPAFESILGAITGSLLPALGNLIDAFGFDITGADLTQGIANFGETIAGGIESFSEFVLVVADLVELYREGGIESVAEHFGIDGDTAKLFLDVGAAMLVAAGAFVALKVAVVGAGIAIGIISSLGVVIGNLGAALALIVGGEGILAVFSALLGGLGAVLLGAVAILIGVIVVFGADALANFLLLKDQLGEIFAKMWELIVEGWIQLKDDVGAIIDVFVARILEAWNQILFDFGVTLGLVRRWERIWEDIKSIVNTIVPEIVGALVDGWNLMVDSVTEFLAPIVERVAEIWEDMKTSLVDAWNDMIDAIRRIAVEIGVMIGLAVINWVAKIKESSEKWKGAGKAIMSGLLRGMKDNVGKILTFITKLAGKVLKTIMTALGANSPSTKFAEIGKFMMEGLAIGIAKNVDLPQIALDAAATRMMSAEGGVANIGASSGQVDRSFNPTINANYSQMQSPGSIMSDLALVAMVEGAV